MSTVNKINIETVNDYSDEYCTFVQNPSSILLYLSRNRKTDNAEVLTNLTINDLIMSNPLYYNPTKFKNIYVFLNKESYLPEIIEFKGNLWESMIINIKNNWNIKSLVWKDNEKRKYNQKEKKYIESSEYDTNLNRFINNLYSNIIRQIE